MYWYASIASCRVLAGAQAVACVVVDVTAMTTHVKWQWHAPLPLLGHTVVAAGNGAGAPLLEVVPPLVSCRRRARQLRADTLTSCLHLPLGSASAPPRSMHGQVYAAYSRPIHVHLAHHRRSLRGLVECGWCVGAVPIARAWRGEVGYGCGRYRQMMIRGHATLDRGWYARGAAGAAAGRSSQLRVCARTGKGD